MNWREWIIEGHKKHPDPDFASTTRYLFRDGATVERVNRLEAELGIPLPYALRELLLQSDGIDMEMYCQGEWFVFLDIVWTYDEIAKRNRALRVDNTPPPHPDEETIPLYFANPGVDGIQFAFFVHPSNIEDPAVHAYYPIEGVWRTVSPSLEANVLECVL